MSYLHCTDFCFYIRPSKGNPPPLPLFFLFASEMYSRQQHSRCHNDLQTSCAFKMTASSLFSHASPNAPLQQTMIEQAHKRAFLHNRHAITLLRTKNPKCLPLLKTVFDKALGSKLYTYRVLPTNSRLGSVNNCATLAGLRFKLFPQ